MLATADGRATWLGWLRVALVALWVAVLGWGYAHVPPSPDQFNLDYIAWRMNEGARPYVDVVDMNWPGGFWMHQVAMRVEGVARGEDGVVLRWYAWRAVDWALMLVCLAFLGDLLRRHVDRRAGWVVWVLYPAWYAGMGWIWFAGQRDVICGQMMWVAAWAWVRAWRSPWLAWHGAVGAVLGLAMLVKPTAGVALPGFALLGYLTHRDAKVKAVSVGALYGLAATAVVLAGFGQAVRQGATPESVVQCAWTYNAQTQGNESTGLLGMLREPGLVHADSWPWITLLAVWGLWHLVTERDRRAADVRWVLPMLWVVGWLNYAAQGKGLAYQMGMNYAAMAALAAVAGARLVRLSTLPRTVAWALPLLVLLVVGGTALKVRNVWPAWSYAAGGLEREQYLGRYEADGPGVNLAHADRLVELIVEHTPEGEGAFTLSIASGVHVQARRPQATRFYYYPVLVHTREPLPMAEAWLVKLEQDLAQSMPSVVVVTDQAVRELEGVNAPAWPILEAFLRDYDRLERVGEATVYLRRRGVPAPLEPPAGGRRDAPAIVEP